MSNYVISHIRTVVPIVVGALISWLTTLGIDIDPETQMGLILGMTGLFQAAWYAVIRALAQRWPWFGVFLGVNKAPEYAIEV
jgi:hypothetical protein